MNRAACDKQCGAVMHMTGGHHCTDCSAYEGTPLHEGVHAFCGAYLGIKCFEAFTAQDHSAWRAFVMQVSTLKDREDCFIAKYKKTGLSRKARALP